MSDKHNDIICIENIVITNPMQVAPVYGTEFWVVCLTDSDLICDYMWTDCMRDFKLLKRGLCHLKEADCILHAKAILKLSGGTL